ncbi:7TM diverse intracellular signaling domain-containing protein [Oligoflexus tunisiensis]|uniref:7TM diverse intracellular signaling domain-containing protein n=1 Tax=Oligoflexus tunisiensis TaxID=708132 RepID=UPI00114D2ACE|nr:7TM diverse intracellular signaling domain-containing protein [Oligoflexus tunisiensis]
MHRVLRLLCLVALVLSGLGNAEERLLILDAVEGRYTVGPYADVYEDKSRRMSFEKAQRYFKRGRFKAEVQEVPNYGFTGRAYWFHLKVIGTENQQEPWFLALEYALVDQIDIYYQDADGNWQHKQSGDRREFATRDLKNRFFYFDMPVRADQPMEIYVRAQTDGASQFVLYFKTLREILKADHESQYFQGMFVGLLAVMIAYYLLMTIGARSMENFYLSAFLFSLLLFHMAMNGLAIEYLWTDFIWWSNASVAFAVPFVFFTALLNAYSFLPVRNYKRLQLTFYVFILILGSECLGSFILPYIAIKGYVVSGMLTILLIFGTSLFMLIKGYKPARFYLLAWVSLMMGAMIYGFQKLGVVPVTFWTTHCVEISASCLVVLLSVGAADKINEINKKIRKAQKVALQAQVEARRVTELMNSQLEGLVKERTEELWQQTKDMSVMLHNIQQGICTVDGDGIIHKEYSSYMEQILEQKGLEGRSLFELIFAKSDQPAEKVQMLHSVLQSCMAEDTVNFDINSHLLPRHIQLVQGNSRRDLEMEWAPIEDAENRVQKVLTAIRDVTEIKKAEAMAAARQRELEVMGRILDLPASKFKRFVQSTRHLLQDCYKILARTDLKDHWYMILRNAHTIKGNARTYGLDEMSKMVHEVENGLFSFDRQKLGPVEREFSIKGLKDIEELLNFYVMIHDEKLKRAAFADFEAALVRLSTLVVAHKDQMSAYLQREFTDILGRLDQLNVNSFHKALQPIISSLKPLAQQLGKQTPTVLIHGIDFYVEPDQTEMLEDIFVHAFRNSLDHGFAPEDQGEITLSIQHEESYTEIIYADNGRGLNLPVLQRKALDRNLITLEASEDEIAHTIFVPGISSAQVVTEISGRGVGMEAVRAFVKLLGGNVEVVLDGPGRQEGYRKFHLRIRLPVQKKIVQRNVHLVAS